MPGFTHLQKVGNSLAMPLQLRANGVPINLAGKTVVYRLYDSAGVLVLEFATGSGLEVTDAAQGLIELTAAKATLRLDAGTYQGIALITAGSDPAYRLELPDDAVADTWSFITDLAA